MKIKIIGLFTIASCLFTYSCSDSGAPETDETTLEEEGNDTYSDEQTSSSCDCESSWFVNGKIVAPAEGNDSPFGPLGYANTTNCLFHQWSWQKFLFLTQVESDETLPFFLTSMYQVDSEMDLVSQPQNMIVLTEKVQAGGLGAMLKSNDSYWNGSDTIYYSIHISDQFKSAADDFRTKVITNPDSINNRWSFPVGSLELKASWANATNMPDNGDYFTTYAEINGDSIKVALLGMHVVGVVENHPEFIWATFEHNNLAPHYDWSSTSASGPDIAVTSPNTNLALFQSGDLAGISDIIWASGQTAIPNPNNVFSIYKYGTPQIAGGGFLPGTSQNTPEDNYNNIDALNNSVHDSLDTWGIDVWANYFYDGSLWMNTDSMSHDQQIDLILGRVNNFGDISTGGPLRGSLAASNISMETYEQCKGSTTSIYDIGISETQSCFTCHGPFAYLPIGGTTGGVSATYISHIFMNHMNETDANATQDEIRKERERIFRAFRANK